MGAYLKNAPAGFAGEVTRVDEANIEPAMQVAVSSVYPLVGYGVKFNQPVAGVTGISVPNGDAATAFAGVMVREVPGISNSSADDTSLAPQTPLVTVPVGLMVRGYASVVCAAGTPARNGTVYWQVSTNNGVNAGSFRADGTDGGNAVALTNTQASWASDGVGTDGSGNTNIAELRVAR